MEYEKITDAEKFASALTELRIEYLTEDYGGLSLTELEQLREKLPHYFQTHLNVDLFAYVCRAGELIAGCCFLFVSEKPPNPSFINGKAGTLLNVYTRPEFRRKGIAGRLIKMLIADSSEMKLDFLELKSTDEGYELYKSLGFEDAVTKYHNMKLIIDKQNRL